MLIYHQSLRERAKGLARPGDGTRSFAVEGRSWSAASGLDEDGNELPQLAEGLFLRSPHPSERNGLFLRDLMFENAHGSPMKAKIAGQRLCVAPHELHAQRCAVPLVDQFHRGN